MTAILHQIKASLYENGLTENPNDYIAKVSSERTLNISEICQAAVSRGGADTTPQAMEHNFKLFMKEMGYQLCDGYSVNTGYFTAGTLIRGVFDSKTETFDPKKHSILFQFNQGDLLRKELPSIQVDIVGLADATNFIAQVTDVKSGSVNDMITPGRNLKIIGNKLRISGNDTCGIFFINQVTGVSSKVDVSDIVVNNPSELIIVIPELAPGTYKLEVKTQFSGSVLLKDPRTFTIDNLLTVQ